MNVVLHELRKIFQWKPVLLTTIVCIICFFVFNVNENLFLTSREGSVAEREVRITAQMIEEFGVWMNDEDWMVFQEETDKLQLKFEEMLNSNAQLQELRITSRNLLINHYWQELSGMDELPFEEELNLAKELERRETFLLIYEGISNRTLSMWSTDQAGRANQTELQRGRNQEILNREAQSILPFFIFLGYYQMIWMATQMIVISLVIMLSPIYLTERKQRMLAMQYTTKLGRKIFQKKLIATILATLGIVTIQLSIIFTMYLKQNVSIFFPADINSFMVGNHVSWFDITFGQYIWLTIGLVYLISLIMGLLITFLSRISSNYLMVLGIQIPIVIFLFFRLFEPLIIRPTSIIFPPHFVPNLYGGLILLIVGLNFYQWRREKLLDLNI